MGLLFGRGQKTRDITGGLPRVAELFEARSPKDWSSFLTYATKKLLSIACCLLPIAHCPLPIDTHKL